LHHHGGNALGSNPETLDRFFTPIGSFALANLNARRTSMKADYATSDLISKVNSDWINKVLVNPELGRTDAGDHHASDLILQSQSTWTPTIHRWGEPVWPSTDTRNLDEAGVADQPAARSSRRRSVARRVTERLALAVAALAVVGVGVRMAPEPRDIANSPEPTASIQTTELRPAWLVPEILYGPAMARSPLQATPMR
jgi:hypothetical protein